MSHWTNYYDDILNFEKFDKAAIQSYAERLGEPSELSSCIGLISIGFQDLEQKLAEGITKLMQVNPQIGDIVTSELSYKSKLDLFFSLIIELRKDYYFNRLDAEGFNQNYLQAFRIALTKCGELRNKAIHSTYSRSKNTEKVHRFKKMSKAKSGFKLINEEFDISHLLNIYDFIVSMEMEIDDFFIEFGKNNEIG